ncbi:MAG: TetR/AcrR family transcriptional regulator [Actinobacteria bacterium]|nr:TetR/AcrR family transcriptional regulator [Actinomycetota bacterium]MBI3687280.1 TetR/AcrR family transcriptional regulator [Actinomycetota bacterium]
MPAPPPGEPGQGSPATRRRGEGLLRAIYTATIDQLAACGYSGLTMEGVAASAGTGKASLYRRWASKDDLIIEAVNHVLLGAADLPDTGSVRDDLLDLLRRTTEVVASPTGCAFYALMRGNPSERDFAMLAKKRLMQPRHALVLELLQRGVERGEVRPEAVTPLIGHVGIAMVSHLIMLNDGQVTPDDLVLIVDDILMPIVRVRDDQPSKSSTTRSLSG